MKEIIKKLEEQVNIVIFHCKEGKTWSTEILKNIQRTKDLLNMLEGKILSDSIIKP